MKRRIISIVCAALLVFSAAGCGSVKASEEDTAAVSAAIEKFAACKSFRIEQVTESTEVAKAGDETFTYNATNVKSISLVNEPQLQLESRTDITVKADEGTMEQNSISYLIPENGGYTEYFSDGSQWRKVSTEDASLLSGFNARAFAAAFFVDVLSFGKAGEDNLDGVKALRYEGQLGGKDLVNMLDMLGYFYNSIGSMSENQQAKIIANLEKDLEPVTVKVWVSEAGYPVRFEVSLTDMLKNLAESISKTLGNLESGEWAITEYEIVMTVSDFDGFDSIELPEEAKSAVIYEIPEGQAS